jgi:hypothetical protein
MSLTMRITAIAGKVMFLSGGLTLSVIVAGEPEYEVSRFSIDGGGIIQSIGGEFELSGTIGQFDSGQLTGGDYEVTGGFWINLPPTDCNDDGLVNFADHQQLSDCLLGPGGGLSAKPCPCYDVDGDRNVTLRDYGNLQSAFVGQ